MSVMRCHKCERWVDTDFEEMVDWDSKPICEDCADDVMEDAIDPKNMIKRAVERVRLSAMSHPLALDDQWAKKNVIQEDAKFKAKYRRK